MNISECLALRQSQSLTRVPASMYVGAVYEKMEAEAIHHLAVYKNEELIGLVDQDSLLKAVMLSPKNFQSLQAQDIMRGSLPVLAADCQLEDVLTEFQQQGIKALPCYDDRGELSMITQTDILRALEQILNGHHSHIESAEIKGELFMANPLVQRIMASLSSIGI